MPTKISMLRIEDMKVAKIIRFHFRDHLCHCDGTVMYTRPFTNTYHSKTPDIIDECILDAIKNTYSDVQTLSCDLMWDNSYSDLQKIYDGGRPKSELTIRMTPALDHSVMPKLVGQTVYAYDFNLNVFLDYIGDPKNIPANIFTTQAFPYDKDKLFSTVVNEIESL